MLHLPAHLPTCLPTSRPSLQAQLPTWSGSRKEMATRMKPPAEPPPAHSRQQRHGAGQVRPALAGLQAGMQQQLRTTSLHCHQLSLGQASQHPASAWQHPATSRSAPTRLVQLKVLVHGRRLQDVLRAGGR